MDLWNRLPTFPGIARGRHGQQLQHQAATELHNFGASRYQQIGDQAEISYKPHSQRNPSIDLDVAETKRLALWKGRYSHGWRFGAINCAISAAVVFSINLIVTIWGSAHSHGKSVLSHGDCDRIKEMNTGIHFLINLLSTILLSSSNYSMQCLSAPTRSEIDKAHAKGMWLDIGIPSVRNLRAISKRRVLMWVLLGLSSLPLHLFYNSAVFSSIAASDYYVYSVSEAFLSNPACQNCSTDGRSEVTGTPLIGLHDSARNGSLERLNNKDCINAYAVMLQTAHRNLLLVLDNSSVPAPDKAIYNGSEVYDFRAYSVEDTTPGNYRYDPYAWICAGGPYYHVSETCTDSVSKVLNDAENWTIGGMKIQYCLSEKPPGLCKLQFSSPIAALVTVLNFIKAAIIFYTAFGIKEDPLMTIGDAVSSFLEHNDPTTKDMCLLSRNDVVKHKGYFPVGPKQFSGQKGHRWKDVTSRTRWWTCFLMYAFAIGLVIGLLMFGVSAMKSSGSVSLSVLASLGLGATNPRTMISGWNIKSIASNVLIANLPQPILSFIYFTYNGLFTCMLLGLEWSQFAYTRKGLRTSRIPQGAQRGSYFLQLPYRFALPLMILSGLLHWLTSQSIFLVAIDAHSYDGEPEAYASYMTCGYSPIAMIAVIILGCLMVVAGIGFGFVKYKPGMTIAGSCSAAISAACHPEDGVYGREAATSKLKWGVVSVQTDGVGHCAFSSREANFPHEGVSYSGMRRMISSDWEKKDD